MDFTTVITTRRSVRAYSGQAIPEAALQRVLEAARVAPSANNGQPWRFVVVKDAATRGKIAVAANGQMFVADAPVVIVCCGKRSNRIDMGIAIEHLALAARNEGLGTCWVGAFQEAPIRKLLGVPGDHDIVMLLPVGYPVSQEQFSAASERLGLDEIVFSERFGTVAGQ